MTARTRSTAPVLVDRLDLSALPRGRISKLRVALVEDGLGRPVRLPVLAAVGAREGPVFGLTAAIHGNELNGIPVIHRLFRDLAPTNLAGTVVGVVAVNVPGLLMQQRDFNTGEDLNHVFPGRPDGNSAEIYVHNFLERVVDQFDLLIDLHTASFGRVNSLYVRADMYDPDTAQMAYRQRPQIIVHGEPHDRTLRGTLAERGVPAITLEIGNPHGYHRDYVKRALAGIRAVLADQGMIRRHHAKPGPQPILCGRSYWMYTDRGGLLEVAPKVNEQVRAGERVAVLRDAFGNVVREYHAPEPGVVVGHSVEPVAQSGSRILHLGIPVLDDHPFQRRDEDTIQ